MTAAPNTSRLAPSRAATAARASGRLLLVDDDAEVRAIAAEMLGELGYQVTPVADGAAALAALRGQGAERYAVLVTDYAMPGLTGLELVVQARAIDPALIVLLITGYMDLAGAAAGQVLRPGEVLPKPFTLRQLAARLAELGGGPGAR